MTDPIGALHERVAALEDGFKLYRSRVEGIGKEFKVLLAEMNIITEWIHEKFGIELINKKSCLYKHIHDYDDVEEISQALTLLTSRRGIIPPGFNLNALIQRQGGQSPASSPTGSIYHPQSPRTSTPGPGGGGPPLPQINDPNNSIGPLLFRPEFIPPHSSASVSISPPPSTPPPHPPAISTSRGSLRNSCDSLPPTTPTRPPSLPPSITLFHQPGLTNPNHHNHNNIRISPQGPMSTPVSPAPVQMTSPPPPPQSTAANIPSSTLIISKKSKPNQLNGPVNPASLIFIPSKHPISPPSTGAGIGGGINSTSIPISLTVLPVAPPPPQPRMIIPLHTSTPYPLHPKKKNAYQNQQLQLQQQQHQQHQADIRKYIKPVVIVGQQQPAVNNVPISIVHTQQSHSSMENDEQGQEQRQKAALQLLTLHDELERRSTNRQHQQQNHSTTTGRNDTEVNSSNAGGITIPIYNKRCDEKPQQQQVFNVDEERGEMVIDVGVEVETELTSLEPPPQGAQHLTGTSGVTITTITDDNAVTVSGDGNRPPNNKRGKKNKDDSNKRTVSEENNKNNVSGGKKRKSPERDYSADAEDEGASSDSTPPATVPSKGQKTRERASKESSGGGRGTKRSRATPSRNNKSPSVYVIDGELPSTSKSGAGSATEESCSSGKPPEKLPKRGRPKKKPEDRVRTYDPRVPMMCDECGKVLKGSGALRVHKQIHANIRPHECKECGKAFRRKHHLEFHTMIHNGDKKETCSYCGKAFLIRRDLARHERTHTGEKPYSCTLCPKSFNVKQHLTLHIRTHTGERPYKCIVCDKTFTQANSLRIHKKIHAREASNAANGTPTGKKPVGGGGGGRSKTPNSGNSSLANASNSTSGVSSASTSALETPPDRERAPSRANSTAAASTGECTMTSRPSRSPSPYNHHQQHPLLRQYESGLEHPPSVAETVTVVTSPLPAHQGQISPSSFHSYHPGTFLMNSSPCRLTLNTGSGTNLLYSRSPTPPSYNPPLAHSNSPANLSVIRPPQHYGGRMITSPTGSGSGGGGNDGRGSPSAENRHQSHSPSYAAYDQQHHNNVTRYYH